MERKPTRGRGRPATGHIKVQFNIRPEINRMIDLGAANQEITRSQYIESLVEEVLQRHFKARRAKEGDTQ
jgi:hypothetical protein